MGTQTAIVKKIWRKWADYVLALKANQGNLLEDVKMYFSGRGLVGKCAYKKTTEKARGKTEKREYWQTDDIFMVKSEKGTGRAKEHCPGIGNKALSLKKKRSAIGTNPEKHLERILSL